MGIRYHVIEAATLAEAQRGESRQVAALSAQAAAWAVLRRRTEGTRAATARMGRRGLYGWELWERQGASAVRVAQEPPRA